jgi:hypothetical protein
MDQTVPTRRSPTPGGQRWDIFDFSEFGPPSTVPYRPWTMNRPDLDRTGPTRTVCKTLTGDDFNYFIQHSHYLLDIIPI